MKMELTSPPWGLELYFRDFKETDKHEKLTKYLTPPAFEVFFNKHTIQALDNSLYTHIKRGQTSYNYNIIGREYYLIHKFRLTF